LLCFSIGLPGHFAEWCDAVIGRLARDRAVEAVVCRWPPDDAMLAYNPVPPILDEVARLLIGTAAGSIVIGARQPDPALRRALSDTQARFVVALDNPRVAAADLLDKTGGDARAVTRAVANSCALLMQYSPLPGAMTLHAGAAHADPAGTVMAIAGHFGMEIDESEAWQIVQELAAEGLAIVPSLESWAGRFPEHGLKTLAGAVAGYEECFAGRGFGQLVWTRELLLAADPEFTTADILDLAGGPRVVVYGPYIHLPAGYWTAQVYLGVSPEAAGQMLLIEAYAGVPLAAASLQPPGAGIFVTEVNFILGEPSGQGVEIRVCVTQEGAQGRLTFGRIVLRPTEVVRQPDAIGEWDDIENVLGL
jgi:hypothetical protein